MFYCTYLTVCSKSPQFECGIAFQNILLDFHLHLFVSENSIIIQEILVCNMQLRIKSVFHTVENYIMNHPVKIKLLQKNPECISLVLQFINYSALLYPQQW